MLRFIQHSGLRTILELCFFLALFLGISLLSNDVPTWIGFALLTLIWFWLLYFNMQKRKKRLAGDFLLFTRNDLAVKTSLISIGVLMVIGSTVWIRGYGLLETELLYFTLTGLILISGGLTYTSNLKLHIGKESLEIESHQDSILRSSFNQVRIQSDSIELRNNELSVYQLDQLHLTAKTLKSLELFLDSYLSDKEVIH
ncbi:MAG: hypothetical protein EP332_09265 [Bacteroidetes bacterium]|nr:MAG: hypothetical protein EP332_09265 [Bacteroidota bacterium]